MSKFIDPATAAHNIATAFCQREIQKLPDSAFIPGDTLYSSPAAKKIWELYSNIYDSVFESAVQENNSFTEEE